MTFMELAKKRYSVRKFKSTPVEQEKIDAMLEAARIAPTAKNFQCERIYVIKSPEVIAKLNALTRCIYGAPLVFLVAYDTDAQWTTPYPEDGDVHSGEVDAAIVATHMIMEAEDLGLGTCYVMWFPVEKTKKALGLPDNEKPVLLIPTGYRADDAKPAPIHEKSKALSEFVKEI